MAKYDYIIVGKWRNRYKIGEITQELRNAGKKVYSFVDNVYDGDGIEFKADSQAEPESGISDLEKIKDWQNNSTFRKIFESDMEGLRSAEELVLVFPAGFSAHMELGVAYGQGKKCYGIGSPEKNETLYLMFDQIFPDVTSLLDANKQEEKAA